MPWAWDIGFIFGFAVRVTLPRPRASKPRAWLVEPYRGVALKSTPATFIKKEMGQLVRLGQLVLISGQLVKLGQLVNS